MMRCLIQIGSLLLLSGSHVALAKLTPEQVQSLPPPAQRRVSFSADIQPIFQASCIKCHGRGRNKGNFRLDTRETLLQGGASGPAVVSGQSTESYLIELVAGVDPDNVMPQKGTKLTREQIGLLRAWIDQGLPWDQSVTFARPAPVNLTPRRPPVPRKRSENPIDTILHPYLATHHFKPPKPVEDRVFARRVYLDVVGLLPSIEELDAFLADKHSDKRARLVQHLLADNQRYAEHWLTFWNDLLRNDYRGTGYIDGGRKQISAWLFSALVTNLSYDRFVAQLIHPATNSEGFTKGIVWRGAVNASQLPPMQAAQNISQVFMGVNLKCASCHDSFINDWTLADSYGLASAYATNELEVFQCDKPTGRKAGVRFIYPALGDIPATTNRTERLQRLAEIMTGPRNGRLSRTIVNRLWARLLGRGLVEPVDDMEQPAWNPALLDWLAEDLVANRYDLKKTLERILTSRAYQWPAVNLEEGISQNYVFRGPGVRRLTAEQFRDALAQILGMWYGQPAGEFNFACLAPARPKNPFALRGQWIWNDTDAAQKTPPARVYFRKEFTLAELPNEAQAVVVCDNNFTLYVNGKQVTSGKDYTRPVPVDLLPHLRKGDNVVAVAAVNNMPDNEAPSTDKPIPDSAANPAGLYFEAKWRSKEITVDLGSDASWLCSTNKADGWEKPGFAADHWTAAAELGPGPMLPWDLNQNIGHIYALPLFKDKTRAALANADPLMVALGRPNREQVMTSRPTAATTLQALELTNGDTLAKVLQRGVDKIFANHPSASTLIDRLYRQGLGRKPTPAELQLAQEVLGQPAKKEGIEDLLWAMTMLPEFQLIH